MPTSKFTNAIVLALAISVAVMGIWLGKLLEKAAIRRQVQIERLVSE